MNSNQNAAAFLNAFERSFESFLNSPGAEKSSNKPINDAVPDRGSAEEISAILSDVANAHSNSSLSNPLSLRGIQKQHHQEPRGSVQHRYQHQPNQPTSNQQQKVDTNLSKPKVRARPVRSSVDEDDDDEIPPLKPSRNPINTDSSERRFRCNSCPKSFKQNSHLKEHEITHSGVFPFNCETCNKGFRRESSLLFHRCYTTFTSVSSPADNKPAKNFKCDVCDRNYASKQSLQLHRCSGKDPVIRSNIHHEELLDNVYIDVPVEIISSDIVFEDEDGKASITGDIFHLNDEEITLEEASAEGWQVEHVSSNDDTGDIDESSRPVVTPVEELPCGLTLLSQDSGVSMDDIMKLIEEFEEETPIPLKFPWQEEVDVNTTDGLLTNVTNTSDDDDDASKPTLEEIPNEIKTPAVSKESVKKVSLNSFTYFNDKAGAVAVGSGDDTSDEDWSEANHIKCNYCKKDFKSKLLLRKHSKTHTATGSTGSTSNPGKLIRTKSRTNDSLLLQEDDETINVNEKGGNSMILFSTLS